MEIVLLTLHKGKKIPSVFVIKNILGFYSLQTAGSCKEDYIPQPHTAVDQSNFGFMRENSVSTYNFGSVIV